MSMTVGELVGFIDLEDRGFDRGLARAEGQLQRLDSVTTSRTGSIESTVTAAFANVSRAIGDGMDPDEALRDLSRLLDGVENALDEAERRAGAGGERAGEAFVRGADGRLRDARGRFVKEGSGLFDGLADGAERSAGLIGKAFDGALSVIGKGGPANVALLVGAIGALPTVANLAAAGIVTAVGGALLAVGLKAAAGADQVRHAWSELGDDLKRELADAAQPLEGSLLRAADVAERTFRRLKPSLARIFEDLVPDVDRFIAKVGEGVGRLGPTLERLGDSFGDVLSELGDRMPAIIDNVSQTLDTFSAMMDEDPQMLANLVEDASELLKVGAEVLAWADDIKAALMLPIDSSVASNKLFEAMFGQDPDALIADMERLPGMIARVEADVTKGIDAMRGLGDSGNEAASGVRNLNDALEEMFDPAAKALDAEIRLKAALKEAAQAAKDKKTTEVDRLRSVQDLTGAIADAAKAESERTGKTTEASRAFADQLPKLVEWAGKNDAARDAVAGLGNSLGVTIKRTDDGKIAFDRFGKAVVTLPNGKTVKVDADTAKALAALNTTKGKIGEVKDKNVKVNADTSKAVSEVGKVKTGLNGLNGDAHKAGQDLGAGLTAGIRSMIGDAIAAAKSLASAALKGAKDFLGIKSPSTVMAEVGRWTVKGLIVGLTEEEGRAVDAVKQMVDKIKEAFKSQPDVADGLVKFVSIGNDSLTALAKQREDLVNRLAAAKEMAKQVAGSAQEWASITGLNAEDFTGAGDMAEELRNKASAINNFANNIKTLAARGLNKKVIQDIIDAGVEKGATFAEMLVGSDGSEIKALNKAQAAVDKASKKLGKASADAMYDTGKKAGEGYLKGLQESLAKLDKEMEKIVKALVAAIKKQLKIKSPSQVFAEIGEFTMQGLVVGMDSMAASVVSSAEAIAKQAAAAAHTAGGGMAGPFPQTQFGEQVGSSAEGTWLPATARGGSAGAGSSTGTIVQVDMTGATIREEADVPKLAAEFGFKIAAHG
ncbi:hypothetical protein [Nonomuraea indica]|uniref:hypothetical protein n=1 Tax=Nonomuraea indica TaxID=1581193 RepID=UPI0011833C54|nr:hypothetical protein [Nonomuraea indica]